ncbi:hypothetical protein DNTS_028481 [Danionella cerebrum]|uniref:C-C motif chemokine n=1 Tax=Danionella cerebrum TaxID=2873325 RepID=A0A553R7G1_9TELE|nr:hypothetical protein DNTS_028481 [Danionella translucida]
MKLIIIFLGCLVLCTQHLMAWTQSPDKCCFSFSNVRIPLKQVESYHTTHLQCNTKGIIFTTKTKGEVCANPSEKWVERLQKLLVEQNIRDMKLSSSGDGV